MAPSVPFKSRLKTQLGLAVERLRIKSETGEAIAKMSRREMATLLEKGRVDTARIRVESIITSDNNNELFDLLKKCCYLLQTRIRYLDFEQANGNDMDEGVKEAVKSILYAAPCTEIKELSQVRALLEAKFGAKSTFVAEARTGEGVNDQVLRRVSTKPPSPGLVDQYLLAIAETYEVPYECRELEVVNAKQDSRAPDGQDQAAVAGQQEESQDGQSQTIKGEQRENLDEGSSSEGEGGGLNENPILAEGLSAARPPQDLEGRLPLSIALPSPSTESPAPKLKGAEGVNIKSSPKPTVKKSTTITSTVMPSKATQADTLSKPDGKIPDVDDLAARFALLKR